MRRVAAIALVLHAAAVAAHDADVIYVSARSGDRPGEVVEVVTLTGAALGQLAPIDADGDGLVSQADLSAKAAAIAVGVWDDMPLTAGGAACARMASTATLQEGYVELSARFACGEGELRQDFRILRVLPANFRVVLGSQVEGETGKAFAQGSLTTLTVPRPPPPGAFSRARFENGLSDGLAAVLWLGALGALFLVLGAAASWRQGLVTCGLVVLGLGPGCLVGSPAVSGALLAALSLAVAVSGKTRWIFGPLLGFGLTARVGGGPWSGQLGVAVGALGAVAVLGPAAVALGRLGQRRPKAWRVARWVVAAAGCFAVGFRVAA
ncbi:MAG: hypothetical protein AB1730_10625 [Myxococcota bacterium]